MVSSRPRIFNRLVGLLTSYTLPPSHFRNGILAKLSYNTVARLCRILTELPLFIPVSRATSCYHIYVVYLCSMDHHAVFTA